MRNSFFLLGLIIFQTTKLFSQTTINGPSSVTGGSYIYYEAQFNPPLNPNTILTWTITGGVIVSQTLQADSIVSCIIRWNDNALKGNIALSGSSSSWDLATPLANKKITFLRQTILCEQANAGSDVSVCSGGVQIGTPAVAGYTYSWSPATGLSNPNIAQPIANPAVSTTYTLTMTPQAISSNLIQNGDFELLLQGFSTDYTIIPVVNPLCNNFTYGSLIAGSDPSAILPQWCNAPDHSPSPGINMLIIDGNCTLNQRIWAQTVSVTANTQYRFSAWGSSNVTNQNLSAARIRIRINTVDIAQNMAIPNSSCNSWIPLVAEWNSGAATTATIEIYDDELDRIGNDFNLDDIAFSDGCPTTTDQVTVTVASGGSPTISPSGPINICTPWEYAPTYTALLTSSTTTSGQYQWYKDGLAISGATSQTHNAQHYQQGVNVRTHQFTVKDPVTGCLSSPVTVNFVPTPLPPIEQQGNFIKGVWTTTRTTANLPVATYNWSIPGAIVSDANVNDPWVDVFFPIGSSSPVSGSVTINGGASCANGTFNYEFLLYAGREYKNFNAPSDHIKTALSPNPANKQIAIDLVENIKQVEIYDALGTVVKRVNKVNGKSITIDVVSLKPGFYFCKVITDKGIENMRFIIQR